MTGIDQNNPLFSLKKNDRLPEQDEQGVDLSLLKENLNSPPPNASAGRTKPGETPSV